MAPGRAGCPLLCPQVSEGPVLVLQPASGLHFPAIEALREAILSRALEGAWAAVPAGCLPPSLCPVCSRKTPGPHPWLSGSSSPQARGVSGCLGWVPAISLQGGGGLLPNVCS